MKDCYLVSTKKSKIETSMVLSSEEKLNSNYVRNKKKRVRKRSMSPKGTLTTPPPNPERTDGVTLPSSDTSSSGKVTQNSDIIQTNPQQSVKRVFRPSHSAPLPSTHQYHSRMHRPLLSRQQGQKNTTLTGSTGQSGFDASSGSLVRNAHRSPADTPGVPFDSAKVRKNAQSTKNMEDPQKKSDAAEHVEERLAKLNRLEEKEQSPKSNPVGNSADLNSTENYSPGLPGAQSAAPSTAKLNKNSHGRKRFGRKMGLYSKSCYLQHEGR